MKHLRRFIFLLIFAIFLIAGFNFGKNLKQVDVNDTQLVITPTMFSSSVVGNQRNILIIGIDQANNPMPQIEGIWLMIYYRDTPRLDLIPIFPSLEESDILRDQVLSGSFSISSNGTPNPNFWTQLSTRDILWHNYILVNEHALNAITDLVGLPNARQSGYLISWNQDPKAALQNQSRLLADICWGFTQTNIPLDITPFIRQLAPHLVTDISNEQIISDWRLILAYGQNLRCEFPTLTP